MDDLNALPAAAFRLLVREWVQANYPPEIRNPPSRLHFHQNKPWYMALANKGWLAPNWPKEFGGPGWNAVQRHLFEEECALAGAPRVVPFGPVMVAPVIMAFGTPEQQEQARINMKAN